MALLRIGGVFVLDDALHGAVGIAHDAAVAGGSGSVTVSSASRSPPLAGHQGAQGVGLGQGHIAREDDRRAIVRQMGTACCTAWPVPSCGPAAQISDQNGL